MCDLLVEDELRVRQVLLEVERVVGVKDDVGLFIDDQHGHCKVSQTGAALASDCPPARDSNAMLVDQRERHEPLRDKAQTSLVHSGSMISNTF